MPSCYREQPFSPPSSGWRRFLPPARAYQRAGQNRPETPPCLLRRQQRHRHDRLRGWPSLPSVAAMRSSGGGTWSPARALQWIWEHPKDGFQQPPFGYYAEALTKYQWDVLCLQPFDRRDSTWPSLFSPSCFLCLPPRTNVKTLAPPCARTCDAKCGRTFRFSRKHL